MIGPGAAASGLVSMAVMKMAAGSVFDAGIRANGRARIVVQSPDSSSVFTMRSRSAEKPAPAGVWGTSLEREAAFRRPVARHQGRECALQRRDLERTAQSHRSRDGVEPAAIQKPVQKPQALLGKRQWQKTGAIDGFQFGACFYRLRSSYGGSQIGQPGSYYGGWITANVTGPFKGAPGTMFW